jgi:hypothetical protein
MRAVLDANGVKNYSKMIFLSHSMGGVVTRAYLLQNRDIADRTAFAYFFSTPTTGSQAASIAQWAFSSPQIAELKSMKAEDYLADVVRQWRAAEFTFPSYCAYEKRPTFGLALVVTMDSASNLCTKPLDPIDADHSGMVKPASENSEPYIAFKFAYLDAMISGLRQKLDTRTQDKLISEIKEIALFPDKLDEQPHKTNMELLFTDRSAEKLFTLLSKYDQDDIRLVQKHGEIISKYKVDYYNYQTDEYKFEETLTSQIGTIVDVRFRQAWHIYLLYFLLRQWNDRKTVESMGNLLNYGITWDDAERVYTLLTADTNVSTHIAHLNNAQAALRQRAGEIFAMYRE